MIRKKPTLSKTSICAQSCAWADSEETLAPPTFLAAAVTVAILGAHQ